MAILSSTGISGFITSAKMTGRQILSTAGKLIPECVSTFVSGVSGWMITQKGDAEFKSVYARDKFITNEFVYNRIRVTEDEEIISSSIKIASYVDNEDGTYTVYPDLREGDINQLSNGDMLVGYYHNPNKSGIIYAIQKFTAQEDPDEVQSIILQPEGDSIPYKYMIIVRVGNIIDEDRQSFIRISSRTNCQYFYDGINSWNAYDDPAHVKCVLGKADIGLIPGWAIAAVGTVKRWFGLIADGVILRGTFVLQSSDKTIEDELDGVGDTITELETRFEIKEGQISASVEEVRTYVTSASDYATSAAGSATSAANSLKVVQECEASVNVTARKITTQVSEITTQVDAATDILKDITEKESSINQTAEGINTKVSETKTYSENAAASATAAANSAAASEAAKLISAEKASEAKQTADGFQNTVTEVTKKAVADAVAGADTVIEEKVSTQVTQSARQWKVEVMGADSDGNPNKILAAINASKEGIRIQGDKIEITGTLLAQIIMATGLNVNDNFKVDKDGKIIAVDGEFKGKIETAIEGKRIVIDPNENAINLFNENGHLVGSIKYVNSSHSSSSNSLSIPLIQLFDKSEDGDIRSKSVYQADSIIMEDRKFGNDKEELYISPRLIEFRKNGVTTKEIWST